MRGGHDPVTAKLARAAARLNVQANASKALPALVLMTDDDRLPDPLPAVRALPDGSLVVLRARDSVRRAAMATKLMEIARACGIRVLIADDPELAVRCGAHGVHFPEIRIGEAARWRARRPRWLITCAAHSLSSCARSHAAHADAAFLAPVFATMSHPEGPYLGAFRARAIALASPLPLYALGGIDAKNAARLANAAFAGFAAIGGLAHDR